jgi:hypothetical protein
MNRFVYNRVDKFCGVCNMFRLGRVDDENTSTVSAETLNSVTAETGSRPEVN